MFIRWRETKHSINQSIIGKRVNLNSTFSFSVSVAQQNTNELCQRMFHCQCSSCSQVYSHCSAQAHFKFCCGTFKKVMLHCGKKMVQHYNIQVVDLPDLFFLVSRVERWFIMKIQVEEGRKERQSTNVTNANPPSRGQLTLK